ncbi:MAG TPA: cysteine desulfurase family protein [Fibrobacteria bacterium]|nr:cysteine desulfurase family protein [Fibrobacteria bacterium]
MIYLDHNATTPPLPEAVAALTRVASTAWGNASSLHGPGRAARVEIENAREELAALTGAQPQEIIFTAGGTEACNFALLGAARHAARALPARHIVVSAMEHPAVKAAARLLEEEGWEVTWVNPDADGIVTPSAVEAALRPQTVLCAVMHANNEVGTVQRIEEIGTLLRGRGVLFFCDMIQSLGKLDIDLSRLPVDCAAFAAHKIGGPKGAGAVYARRGLRLEPLVRGGGQERGLRGGTENVPGIAGFGAAAAWWRREGVAERARVARLRDALEGALVDALGDAPPPSFRAAPGAGGDVLPVRVTAAGVPRLPGTLHVVFDGVRGDTLVMALDLRGIAVSAGSACASGSVKPSEVLLAMGRTPEEAVSALRFSLGFGNTAEEIPVVAEAVARAYTAARTA